MLELGRCQYFRSVYGIWYLKIPRYRFSIGIPDPPLVYALCNCFCIDCYYNIALLLFFSQRTYSQLIEQHCLAVYILVVICHFGVCLCLVLLSIMFKKSAYFRFSRKHTMTCFQCFVLELS